MSMLKLKIIACDVLNREISFLSSQSGCFVDVTYLPQGLHRTPDKLRQCLQQKINKANEGFPYNYFGSDSHYDYIIIGYGLCCNSIAGISSPNIPLVIPRGHDCITFLLGSKERYKELFDENSATFWFSAGWIERGGPPGEEMLKTKYKEYVEKYGEDNAQYLMEMEQSWLKDYNIAALILWDSLNNATFYKNYTKKNAEFLNWHYKELVGDKSLLERLINGIFNENEVLIVPQGKKVAPSYDDSIVKIE